MKKKLTLSLLLLTSTLLFSSPLVKSEESLQSSTSSELQTSTSTVEDNTSYESSSSREMEDTINSSENIYVEDSSQSTDTSSVQDAQIKQVITDKYVTILDNTATIYQEANVSSTVVPFKLNNQTFRTDEEIITNDTDTFYSLIDANNQLVGYILKEYVSMAEGAQGVLLDETNAYIFLEDKQATLYTSFDWSISPITPYLNKTLRTNGHYNHANGETYDVVYDYAGKKLGYINQKDTQKTNGWQGPWFKEDKYITITNKSYDTYSNFSWKVKHKRNTLMNKVLKVQGSYKHANGSLYYSLYDSNGVWYGYINANATKTSNIQGPWIKENKYVTLTNKNYNSYSNFNWKVKNSGNSLLNKTYKVTGSYKHFNGRTYYSLYDNKGKWQGYVNKNATKTGAGQQGAFISSNDYATITTNNYSVWQNFNWKLKQKSSKLYQKTYQVRGYYRHFNGSKYYSLYDNKGKWQGYINANGAKVGAGKQGIWIASNNSVTFKPNNYDLWQNFNWKPKNKSGQLKDSSYQAKGYYNHFNGSRYYSIYNKSNVWQGYINANGLSFVRGVGLYLGTTRDSLINHLGAHEHDGYYLGTPYRSVLGHPNPAYVLSPNGKPTYLGPGLNCTGFVSVAYQNSGADVNKITRASNQRGGLGNAYNWKNALVKNTDYYTYNSVSALLAGGKAKKGDIIYFEPDYSKPGPDPHIGIFWGNSSKHDRIWHSTYPKNNISNIRSGTPYTKIFLFPVD